MEIEFYTSNTYLQLNQIFKDYSDSDYIISRDMNTGQPVNRFALFSHQSELKGKENCDFRMFGYGVKDLSGFLLCTLSLGFNGLSLFFQRFIIWQCPT